MMGNKVYINSYAVINGSGLDIDYKQYLSPIESRRMSPLMKRAAATVEIALKEAGLDRPDAIISGTGYGCLLNSETFLHSMVGLDDEALRPTHFMQSTHNTVSSMIAIKYKCHGYNATYSHRYHSFESAMLDAFMQVASDSSGNVLVGAFEELTPTFSIILSKMGHRPYASDGDLSETAASFVVSNNIGSALCQIDDVMIRRKADREEYENAITGYLKKFSEGVSVISRDDYESEYGGNFCVSANGVIEAIKKVVSGENHHAVVGNFCAGQGFSLIVLSAVCGD